MKGRKVFSFVLLMSAFVLGGAWGIAGWAGLLLAIGSVGLYLVYDLERGKAHAASIRGSSETVDSIAHRVSDIADALDSIREELRKEREEEKERERRRFWRKVETQDGGGPFPIN
jgi:hypothetical protein